MHILHTPDDLHDLLTKTLLSPEGRRADYQQKLKYVRKNARIAQHYARVTPERVVDFLVGPEGHLSKLCELNGRSALPAAARNTLAQAGQTPHPVPYWAKKLLSSA
eukprot:1152666-Amphidinium_carterae.1